MSDTEKVITEGEIKDLILKYAINNEDKAISASIIHKEILSDISYDEVELLIKKLNNTIDDIADIIIGDYGSFITATGVTKRFIDQGGFTKIEEDNRIAEEKHLEQEKIKFEHIQIED